MFVFLPVIYSPCTIFYYRTVSRYSQELMRWTTESRFDYRIDREFFSSPEWLCDPKILLTTGFQVSIGEQRPGLKLTIKYHR